MMRSFPAVLGVLVALVASGVARPAWGHAAPHSILLLDLRDSDVNAELRVPIPELEAALGRPLAAEPSALLGEGRVLAALVARDLHVFSRDGRAWSVRVGAVEYALDEQAPVLVANATLTPPAAHSTRAFTLVDDVIGRQIANHVTWVGVRRDFAQGFVSGPPRLLGVTRYLHHSLSVDRESGSLLRGLHAVFRLGVEHIAQGTDHLLFLLALLLPAPLRLGYGARGRKCWSEPDTVRASLLKILRVVSAFTLGHSLTLLLGAFGWLRLPSAPVETLIAVSILCSAVHALRPLFPGREAWVAAGFGLVHGLAFASALAELRLEPARLVLSLLGFNLGIEAMQLGVIAAALPWLLLLARTRLYPAFRRIGALFAASAALGWIAQRALLIPTPVDAIVGALAAHPAMLLSGLAALALLARAGERFARTPRRAILLAGE